MGQLNNFVPGNFLERLKRQQPPIFNKALYIKKGHDEWVHEFRSALTNSLGIDNLIKSMVKKKARFLWRIEHDSCFVEKYSLSLFEDLSFPVYTMRDKKLTGPFKPILACHGHGPGVDAMIGIKTKEECHHFFGTTLAKAGFYVVMPEFLGFGECRLPKDSQGPVENNSCTSLASWLLPLGMTLAGIRILEARAALDFIMDQDNMAGSPGCFGFSGGGLIASFLTAIDDRIGLCALAGYGSTFLGSIMKETHCLDNYIPNLGSLCEFADLANLICPRPLFMETATEDNCFPLDGTDQSFRKIEEYYELSGCRDNLDRSIPQGPHEINGEKLIPWLCKRRNI